MKLKNRTISIKNPPFVIAEISANHNNNISRVLKLIDEAKNARADAVKLQTYTAETMTLNSKKKDFLIKDKKSLWNNKYLFDLYKIGSTPWEWHRAIFERAKKNKIICFSTPFDETAVDFLSKFKVPAYKVSSFENNHFPLIKKIISKKKPIIISTGATNLREIKSVVNYCQKLKFNNLALLKCTSSYPAIESDSNILTIPDMKKKFNFEIGLSDHTPGIGASIAAVSHGATIIEKHFTLDKKAGGLDDSFSIDPKELSELVSECKRAWLSLGKVFYGINKSEKKSLIFKRSIYSCRDIKKGEKFTNKNIKIVRPNYGLPPIFFEKMLGKKALKHIKKASAIKLNHFKK